MSSHQINPVATNVATFKLPITYIDHQPLAANVSADLELPKVYQTLLKPATSAAADTAALWYKQTTTNQDFLRETQELIVKNPITDSAPLIDIMAIFNEITKGPKFLELNGYIEHEQLRFLNKSPLFMQCYSMTNLYSPLISLVYPLIILIIPFILLICMGHAVTVSTYVDKLRETARSHVIGKVLNFSPDSLKSVAYLVVSVLFYIYSTYQNYVSCKRYYSQLERISEHLATLKDYCRTRINLIGLFCDACRDKPTYAAFCADLRRTSATLERFVGELPDTRFSMRNVHIMGSLLQTYYTIHTDEVIKGAIQYSFGFSGYIDNLRAISGEMAGGSLKPCKFSDSGSTKFVEQVYPLLATNGRKTGLSEGGADVVKNTVSLKKNIVLTGPNASGKTTILKTTAINVILSQQVGAGFYGDGTVVVPFDHIHSYLNIPDTSERDSLFQAESRRCKEILDKVSLGDRHFCIFDELYSGTNPTSAVKAAHALLSYMAKNPRIRFCLTTHYVDLCERLQKNEQIVLCKMDTTVTDTDDDKHVNFTYKIAKGISTVDVVWNILKDLGYPDEIMDAL
jgi:energy-coupling factor transporter ATP-binding protein EcfA2